MALRMVVKVQALGAWGPVKGSLAAMPKRASRSGLRAQTLRTALVCMMVGLQGELSANMEW